MGINRQNAGDGRRAEKGLAGHPRSAGPPGGTADPAAPLKRRGYPVVGVVKDATRFIIFR